MDACSTLDVIYILADKGWGIEPQSNRFKRQATQKDCPGADGGELT
jgi:hypothetical protein